MVYSCIPWHVVGSWHTLAEDEELSEEKIQRAKLNLRALLMVYHDPLILFIYSFEHSFIEKPMSFCVFS